MPRPNRIIAQPTSEAESDAGRRTVARALRIGMWIWGTFGLLDVYMCLVAFPGAPLALFLAYRAVMMLAFYAVYRASQRGRMEIKRLFWLQNLCYSGSAVAIALMAVNLGGIRSPYLHGISVIALVRATLVPTQWRLGIRTYARIALAFPMVMGIGAVLSASARQDWLSAEALISFVSNYVFVLASSFIGLIAGHIVWSAREQLFRARRVGRYRLQAPIGKGGMGEVWLAWDESLHRNVALKILRVGTGAGVDAVTRFEREAQAAGQLLGKHVVRVFDFGASEDGLYFIAMEYLAGMNLANVVDRFGPMPPARVALLGIQACLALEEAHGAGIIHRDLKPHNLYLTRTPEDPELLKLLDFGIARLRPGVDEAHAARLTLSGAMIGTPAFLAPELWQGREADERSDLYSLGVTLYFLLTGETPLGSPMYAEPAAGVAPSAAVPADRSGGADARRLEAVLRRCLARLPEDRMQTAQELRKELEALSDPAGWTVADAEVFWQRTERERFG